MSEVISQWATGLVCIFSFCRMTGFKIDLNGVFALIGVTIFPYGIGHALFFLLRGPL